MKTIITLALVVMGAFAVRVTAQTVDNVITNGLFEPHSVAVDPVDNIYITDGANNRIVKYAADTGLIVTLAGSANEAGYVNGIGILARFFDPKGLIYVPALRSLVVADSGNHVIRLVSSNGVVSLLAGVPGQAGLRDGAADGALFSSPAGLSADAIGNIYVADSKNNAIRKIALNGQVSTFASGLYEPAAVAVSPSGDVWVADTRNHTIKAYSSAGVLDPNRVFGSNSRHVSGSQDALIGKEALFNNPRGVMWIGTGAGLLVSDSGNHTLRRIATNAALGTFSVDTFAGIPGQAGQVNGPLLAAKFNSPIGLASETANSGFLIVDSAGSALRRIQTSPPRPPVSTPTIGWVDFVKDNFGDFVSVLVPVTQSVFNNNVTIAILAEAGTETFFTSGPTPPNPAEDNIPFPSRATGRSPVPYENGQRPPAGPSIIQPLHDVTIKAISAQDGRRPSSLVQARFQFKTANPVIDGDNPASFRIINSTGGALMYFTTNGISDPTIHPDGLPGPNTFGPFETGTTLSLPADPFSTNLIRFRIRGFRGNFKDSEIAAKDFSPTNFVPNRITFGFETGEASSRFRASAGQRFYAPVTLSLLPDTTIFSLQFNLTVANLPGSEPIRPTTLEGTLAFESMLKLFVPPASYFTLKPNAYEINGDHYRLLLTATNQSMLEVGWLVRSGLRYYLFPTNSLIRPVWDTTVQDLVSFSIAHDTLFRSVDRRVVVGGYSFVVPTNAPNGSGYEIKIGRASATSDGVGGPGGNLFIQEVPRGGTFSSVQTVRIAPLSYVVGDVAPFRWFNAGDFGNSNLLSDDVLQVYQSAIHGLNLPPGSDTTPRSDFFDALDSAGGGPGGGPDPALLDGDDTGINNILSGDGNLNVNDVYVTFRRSLDPTLDWVLRYWEGGQRLARTVRQVDVRGVPAMAARRYSSSPAQATAVTSASESPSVTFQVAEIHGDAGQVVDIPIRATIEGHYPIRVLMLNLNVRPLDSSPPVAESVEFIPAPGLGQPRLVTPLGAGNFSAAWLDNTVEGVSGEAVLGILRVKLPATASRSSAYRVEFEHASASPNGLGLLPKRIVNGLVYLGNIEQSSWNDGIPDSWRFRHFGSLANLLSSATADADGDGVPNWVEFKAGTVPTDVLSVLRLVTERRQGQGQAQNRGITLRWPSVADKRYVVEWSTRVSGGIWTVVAGNIIGTGQDVEFTDDQAARQAQFYRVRIAD